MDRRSESRVPLRSVRASDPSRVTRGLMSQVLNRALQFSGRSITTLKSLIVTRIRHDLRATQGGCASMVQRIKSAFLFAYSP